jgi:Tfp pilus assembly protein PilF
LLEGDVQLALRDAASASRSFADAYRLSPSSAAAIRVYRARSLARLPAPAATLAQWLQRRPQDLGARMIFAQSLLEQGQTADAIVHYERVVAGGRAGAMALNNLAWLYQQVHDPRAEATAKRAYELAPDVPAVADTYGWILVEAGNVAAALPILERAVAARGALPEMRYHHAVALARGGRRDEARASLRQLLAVPGFTQAAQARELLKELGDAP